MAVIWDVHHGNGTQAIFWDDPSVLATRCTRTASIARSGLLSETGAGAGAGTALNVPLPSGSGTGRTSTQSIASFSRRSTRSRPTSS